MSRAQRRCDEISRIRALRMLSTRVAEHDVLAKQRALDLAVDKHKAAELALGETVADWGRTLSAPSFDPHAVTLRSAAVNRGLEHVATCGATVGEQREALVSAQDGCHRAGAEEQCASMLWRDAHARLARQLEERALAVRDDETTRAALRR